jgi:hypothetical protein
MSAVLPMRKMLTPYGAYGYAIRSELPNLGEISRNRFFKYPVVKNVETHILRVFRDCFLPHQATNHG